MSRTGGSWARAPTQPNRAPAKAGIKFFDFSLDLHVIASPDGYFKHVSESAPSVLGWSVAELRSRPFLKEFVVHPDDRAATVAEVNRQILAGEKVLLFENRYRHKDGSWRVLAWKSMPSGGLMYATARDITHRRRLQQELADAKNAAEAANRELESFSYSVAHDLRAPAPQHRQGLATAARRGRRNSTAGSRVAI